MAKRPVARKSQPRRRKSARRIEAGPEATAGDRREAWPIVGIGASAGGLEAFEEFLSHTQPDSGMAYIMVPHLDARHRSAMTELLQRYTAMKVVEITDGMAVEPDRVHVIPPDGTLTIERGTLRVAKPRKPGNTIDAFFRSLAEDQDELAIGVILSGSGSDGALGIKAIKEHGGLTVAQTSLSSRFDSMPHSAVATGLVDFVVTIKEMPAKLADYARRLTAASSKRTAEVLREAGGRQLHKIYALLRSRTSHDFSRYKDSTVIRRVQRRMQVVEVASVPEYIDLLRKDGREVELLFRDLLIGVTQFFRDPAAFDALASEVMPKLIASKNADDQIRFWVAGCATGEEAYSLGILLAEQLARVDAPPKVQIFATDIDDQALEVARAGYYPAASLRDISPERLERYFVKDGTGYRVLKEVREMCIFSVHNLIKDAPFSRLDLVSCRNLLIYLDATLQNRIIPLFHFSLRNGGYLLLGSSENVTQHAKLFTRIDGRHRIFKARTVERPPIEFPLETATHRGQRASEPGAAPPTIEESVSRRAMRLVESYAPAFVVVDEHQDVLRFSGRTGKYIQPSAGAASLNLFTLLEAGLRTEVRATLHKAMTSGRKVMQENVFVGVNGGRQSLNIIVEPVPAGDGGSHFFVVLFQDVGPVKTADAAEKRPVMDVEKHEAIANLESELLATRERLQTTIEELETANEEMKASNEEFQSVNEELQSSNEELETSKEELQSVNEELETVNSELNSKVDSLERAMSDRKNLLESTQIATLFLDDALRITSFTPAIVDIFHLIDSDLGRPITDIVTRLAYDGVDHDIRKVLRTLTPIEQEVAVGDGSAVYAMRILPYRTIDNVIGGVVITFVDITDRKRNEESLARLASIVAASDEAIIGMALDGTITTWNAGAQRIYGYGADEAVGQSWSMLMPAERSADLRAIIEGIKRSRSTTMADAERVAKSGGLFHVATTVSPIRDPTGQVIGLSSIERDISQRKHGEERQRLLLAELNHRVKNTLATVLSISAQTLRHSSSVEAFAEAFEGRIQALAKAHDLLAASNWQGADLREVLLAGLAAHRQRDGHLSLDGEAMSLAPNAALMLGMVVHELATNAAKYGAFTNEAGRVAVAWKSDGGSELLKITWAENGAPKVERPRQDGFGLALIERGIAHELQGRATFDFSDGGLRCSMEIPLAELRPPVPPSAGTRDQ